MKKGDSFEDQLLIHFRHQVLQSSKQKNANLLKHSTTRSIVFQNVLIMLYTYLSKDAKNVGQTTS